jgi:hypothetical protein
MKRGEQASKVWIHSGREEFISWDLFLFGYILADTFVRVRFGSGRRWGLWKGSFRWMQLFQWHGLCKRYLIDELHEGTYMLVKLDGPDA